MDSNKMTLRIASSFFKKKVLSQFLPRGFKQHIKTSLLPTSFRGTVRKAHAKIVKEPKITKPSRVNPILSIVPKSIFNVIFSKQIIKEYKKDVYDDFKIWENKKYIIRTPLAPGDGPIGFYRLWARQFYTEQTPDILV